MAKKQTPVESKTVTKDGLDTTLDKSLEKILALRPVTWKWKSEKDGTEVEYGFIAQEVEKVIPHLVSNGKWRDGTTRKFLTVTALIPYLVAAIKEQQVQIIELQSILNRRKK
ncbi:MAG: tail fiber domain-containing protein [Candidatus Levyibacteriota bacterium]